MKTYLPSRITQNENECNNYGYSEKAAPMARFEHFAFLRNLAIMSLVYKEVHQDQVLLIRHTYQLYA